MQMQEDRSWNSKIKQNDESEEMFSPSLRESEYITHFLIGHACEDSIRLSIILLVPERIWSKSQIWKITGHDYRG